MGSHKDREYGGDRGDGEGREDGGDREDGEGREENPKFKILKSSLLLLQFPVNGELQL